MVVLDVFPLIVLSNDRPQIKQDIGWGSRPIDGRDWGSSEPVDEDVLGVFHDRLSEIGKLVDDRKSIGSKDGVPYIPMADDMESLKGRASHLSIDEVEEEQGNMFEYEENHRVLRRRRASLAKHYRVSLCAAASMDPTLVSLPRRSNFPVKPVEPVQFEQKTLLSDDMHTFPKLCVPEQNASADCMAPMQNDEILDKIFSFLNERDLMRSSSLVCSQWYETSAMAYARLMMASVGYHEETHDSEDGASQSGIDPGVRVKNIALTSRNWDYLTTRFPWGVFLSEGGFKRVYKVFNTAVNAEEAISVMDVEAISDKKTIAAELAVSVLLSSLSRRGVCPNFVITRGVFTLPYEPPHTHWGSKKNKFPKGRKFNASSINRKPREPKNPAPGRFQFIRMELCNRGDAEDFISKQPGKQLDRHAARCALFQIAFALHVGAERFSLKHYDIKLLNVFIQATESPHPMVLRYSLGSHTFALNMPGDMAFIAKLADYGTANIKSESNGQPVTVAQFTTLENTPPEFMVLGDNATQGHSHDAWGLGLSMLHLFTGYAPYEEILHDVFCPPFLKRKLKQVWESRKFDKFSVIRSVIRADVYEDRNGNIIEGEPDETLYDTLYRYLVLFGIPDKQCDGKPSNPVWKAILSSLWAKSGSGGRRRVQGTDVLQYENDCRKYSIHYGSNEYISIARQSLEEMEGGLDLLRSLCSYDPAERATPLQVINSTFMASLREAHGATYCASAKILTYDYNPSTDPHENYSTEYMQSF